MSEAVKTELDSAQEKIQVSTFWLSGRLFGVDIMDVKEINTEVDFTPIYHSSKEVKGYVNIRGQIHLVLDLRLLMGFESKEVDIDSRVVIFKQSIAEPFGALVDKVEDILEVPLAQVEEYQGQDDAGYVVGEQTRNSGLVKSICKLEDGLLIILNARNILRSIETGQSANQK